jgi:hypothetical protein
LDPGHTVERPARLPAPLVRQQRKHDPAPCCGSAFGNWRERPPVKKICPITIARSLTRALGFSSYLPEFALQPNVRFRGADSTGRCNTF